MATVRTMLELDTQSLESAAHCLRTLAHPVRLRMVALLFEAEHTVGELAEACGIPSAVASDHLSKMKDRGLLVSERRGRCTHYKPVHGALAGILSCIAHNYGHASTARGSKSRRS